MKKAFIAASAAAAAALLPSAASAEEVLLYGCTKDMYSVTLRIDAKGQIGTKSMKDILRDAFSETLRQLSAPAFFGSQGQAVFIEQIKKTTAAEQETSKAVSSPDFGYQFVAMPELGKRRCVIA